MAFTLEDFDKIWASTSPLTPYEFSDTNYQQGWNFIGSTPPARQMWDFLQKQNDEKAQWLYNAHNDILEMLKSLIPTGVVQAFAGSTLPDGWLLCDGSAVSRTTYARLFEVIGTTYGSGDGSNTFNVPNLTDRFIQGNATAGTVKSAGLPNIEGAFSFEIGNNAYLKVGTANGAFTAIGKWGYRPSSYADGSESAKNVISFSASNGSSVYGNSTTVQPPALTMRYIIKY